MISLFRARIDSGLLSRRWITSALAVLLILASALVALQSERESYSARERQLSVQASILAGSVAGSLAFDDPATTREYLSVLRLNKDIKAAAVFDGEGVLVAGFAVAGGPLPRRVQLHPPELTGDYLTAVEPVQQGELQLGRVYLRTAIEPWMVRAGRYLSMALVIVLAALVIFILGAAHAAAVEANRRLQEETRARERAEAELRQAQKMEALGQLTGGVAHDFNNLIMAATSGLDLLERTTDPTRREKLRLGIRDALERGSKVTQQLLDFSRRNPLKTELVDVCDRLRSLRDLLDRALQDGLAIEYQFAATAWPVEIDPAQFDVAILNLVVNARDAMPDGGTICIHVENSSNGLDGQDCVNVSVADEGCGMPPAAIERAFEPFFTTKPVGKGSGLGLSQVYGFATASKGTVSITSVEGRSTAVTIRLPRARPDTKWTA